jgi:hypothetical protein
MKLFTILFEQEYDGLSDQELIQLIRKKTLTGVSYFALQRVLSKRGLTPCRIIGIEKDAYQKKKRQQWCAEPFFLS